MVLKFKRTERVRNVFKSIAERVGEVIHRIDAPLIACAVMFHMTDTVHNRITHIHVT